MGFDAQRRIRSQELAGPGGRPAKKILHDEAGNEERQCIDSTGDGRFDLVVFREGAALRETWTVSEPSEDDDPRADQRELYADGRRVRAEFDTQGDGRPDVVQYLDENEAMVRQDEDSNHDGRLDVRFEGGRSVVVSDPPEAPAPLKRLGCGRFARYSDPH